MGDLVMTTALVVGLITMALLLLALIGFVALMAWRYWPVGLCRITVKKPRLRHGGVPRIDWRAESGMFTPVHALIGLTSRRKVRWFFGLMLMNGDHYDTALAASSINRKEQS